jgi:beta-glucosidase
MKKAGLRDYQDIEYQEGVFVGYRYLDSAGIEPLFCFRRGLSYSRFFYSEMSVGKTAQSVTGSF